ncbi:hypothetical protein HGM15179_004773 [Zosterops borbonicus]|uniref:Uncharacterized protein n=1 Tax=Zosterops borbonicus TaxID=364589 RepID=A0A8K1GQR1_9PASS|nr:hypothetical protein HGM15179_004773 [Zosterops borbonicus]
MSRYEHGYVCEGTQNIFLRVLCSDTASPVTMGLAAREWLNSITPYACLVFGSYSPAQKLQLSYRVEVVAVFTPPIARCSSTAVGKEIESEIANTMETSLRAAGNPPAKPPCYKEQPKLMEAVPQEVDLAGNQVGLALVQPPNDTAAKAMKDGIWDIAYGIWDMGYRIWDMESTLTTTTSHI